MSDVFEVLLERGFIQQCTDAEAVRKLLSTEQVTFYVGFDPTADSLHAGSMLALMGMAHLQRAGHRPIAIIGGGTTLVGDPSGKTELRRMMSREEIESNGRKLLSQMQRYLDFGEGRGLFLNNADWLCALSYVDFLRDVGRLFKVNELIKVEAYRQRLEREEGLSFLEFNYQLLQSYDFLVLFQQYSCVLQAGGDDQWGNIVSGMDLIRRKEGKPAFGLTFPLLQTSRGEKMGKTAAGAVWLSAERTPPYDYYQFWINTDDRDVQRFLGYFTFLPMDEVRRLGGLQGADIREAKQVLAYEATKLAHGAAAADEARQAARALFGQGEQDASAIPTSTVDAGRFGAGVSLVELFVETGLATSKGAARRLIDQGGAYVNDQQVRDVAALITEQHFSDGALLLRHGKKKYHRVVLG